MLENTEHTEENQAIPGECGAVSAPGSGSCLAAAAVSLFLAALGGCLFYCFCYIRGSVFYLYHSFLLYHQCLFGVLFAFSGILFRLSGAGIRLWCGALVLAGVSPFLSWFAQTEGSFYLEVNLWVFLVSAALMLDAYPSYVQELCIQLGIGHKHLGVFLSGQKKIVLYTAVVPFGAFAGSCYMSRGMVFQGLLQQMFGGEYWAISRYLVILIGINLLLPAVDSLCFFYDLIKNRHCLKK